jgi:hypothetical protein
MPEVTREAWPKAQRENLDSRSQLPLMSYYHAAPLPPNGVASNPNPPDVG